MVDWRLALPADAVVAPSACGLRLGYFRSAYERILRMCDQAEAWGTVA